VKLTQLIEVWDILHRNDTGDLGFCDMVQAVEDVAGVENDIDPELPQEQKPLGKPMAPPTEIQFDQSGYDVIYFPTGEEKAQRGNVVLWDDDYWVVTCVDGPETFLILALNTDDEVEGPDDMLLDTAIDEFTVVAPSVMEFLKARVNEVLQARIVEVQRK
jgi:hypothetical protein